MTRVVADMSMSRERDLIWACRRWSTPRRKLSVIMGHGTLADPVVADRPARYGQVVAG